MATKNTNWASSCNIPSIIPYIFTLHKPPSGAAAHEVFGKVLRPFVLGQALAAELLKGEGKQMRQIDSIEFRLEDKVDLVEHMLGIPLWPVDILTAGRLKLPMVSLGDITQYNGDVVLGGEAHHVPEKD